MTLDECFERRQLRSVAADPLKARSSVQTASDKLKQAQELAGAGFAQVALVTAYAAMFHAGRALLYRDGIQEKSHYCLVLYLREKYVKTSLIESRFITIMDALREERHDVMYSIEKVNVKSSEVNFAIKTAGDFIKKVELILSKEKT